MAMISSGHLSFLLVLLTSFTLSPIFAYDDGVVVDIESHLPRHSKELLKLECGSPWIEVKAGDHHTLKLTPQEDALDCSARWFPYFNIWSAYDAHADRRHLRVNNTIFWRINVHGFYRSWDRSFWKRILGWYIE